MSGSSKEKIPLPTLAIIGLVTILVILSGIIFYHSQKRKIITEKQNELVAIASLKINEIESWRDEHLRDGEILQTIIPRNRVIQDFLENRNTGEMRSELIERMKIFFSDYDYHSVLLTDTAGSVRFVYPRSDETSPVNRPVFNNLRSTDIILSDFHYSADLPGKIHIDLQIPLYASGTNVKARFGTVIMRIDPEKKLYPLIQSWPSPSRSSETLLVRADGDSILFLNELKHQKNTALQLRLPKYKDLPAARAVTGYEGIFEGVDYRGIPVISYLKRIPGSSWFMVTKVDKKEIYSSLNELILFTSIITTLLVLLFGILLVYLWRNQHISHLRELNSTKDKFFSIVSHDLRSPFTSIYGFADILAEETRRKDTTGIDIDNVRRYAEIIRYSSQNAVDLLRNLTEWARLNTDRLVFNPGEFDLVSVINSEVSLLKAAATQKSLRLEIKAPSSLGIFADKNMISLVIRNLISNSIKFSNPGGDIRISVANTGREVRMDVCDTGVGIRKDIKDKLFRIEEIVTTPGTNREQGTGLGLILVKEFITLHKGSVYVESEAGKCTRFSISLPVSK